MEGNVPKRATVTLVFDIQYQQRVEEILKAFPKPMEWLSVSSQEDIRYSVTLDSPEDFQALGAAFKDVFTEQYFGLTLDHRGKEVE